MPECRDCEKYIRSGSRCQMHQLEHQFGTSIDGVDEEDLEDDWVVVQQGLGDEDAEGQTTIDGGIAKEDT